MKKNIGFLHSKWTRWRQKKITAALYELKARYHTFRIILSNNETALELLKSIDQTMRSSAMSWDSLSSEIDELLETTYELVDGLVRIGKGSHSALYARYSFLSADIRKQVESAISSHRASFCVFLDDFQSDMAGIAGSKASNLAFLKKAGFQVPDGFVLTAPACSEILSFNGIDSFIKQRLQRMENAPSLNAAELDADSAEIRKRIMDARIPVELENELRVFHERLTGNSGNAMSVRSSALAEDKADHSFAGQFKSILNVIFFESLKNAILDVIASGFSPRAIIYRMHAGLPLAGSDMAVLCQLMADARAAGVMFTVNPTHNLADNPGDNTSGPEKGRMLISAVPGLGISAVGGSAPADLYMPLRDRPEDIPFSEWSKLAFKNRRCVVSSGEGIMSEEISFDAGEVSVLSFDEACRLARCGRMVESLYGKPQDIEWAIDECGGISLLQSREIRLGPKKSQKFDPSQGEVMLSGGVCASSGKCAGKAVLVSSAEDVKSVKKDIETPYIMVLRQSMVDAAAWLECFEGVVVDLGNPADHLSCVAREYGIPMLTSTGAASSTLKDGDWIILDADSASVRRAPEGITSYTRRKKTVVKESDDSASTHFPELARLRKMIEPLNLTDSYGPTFSIQECRSVHDIIRYVHEMAVLSMFDAGDVLLENAGSMVHRLDEGIPFHFLILDLGGGILPEKKSMKIRPSDIHSTPFLSLWEGISTPGLRWNQAPPAPAVSGLFTKAMLDGRSARPVGNQNYAMITRDYLNLNARVDFHFAMVDAVCGINPRGNHIRFRFKGGGTTAVQRERRARFVVQVMKEYGFSCQQHEDLVTASIFELRAEDIRERLVMTGRLLGFSRLLDAVMADDDSPAKVADAFMKGDYALGEMYGDQKAQKNS